MTAEERYRQRKPWIKYICWAKRRCTDRKSKWWPYYGAKGITCSLNVDEAEHLWKRDGAAKMKKPSLDRIKSHLNYTVGNCRFIEFVLNSRMGWDPKARPEAEAHEYDPDGDSFDAEEWANMGLGI